MDRIRTVWRWLACAALIVALSASAVAQSPEPYVEKLPKSLGKIAMVPVPGGTVTLDDPASPGTPVTVQVSPFFMSATEVRWDEFNSWVYRLDLTDAEAAAGVDSENRPSMPYVPPDRGFGTDGMPVISVSYLNAAKFCEWLSKATGHTYRLPTEAEWAWAAIGGAQGVSDQATCPTPDPVALEKTAWYGKTMENPNHQPPGPGPMPVKEKEANAYGLYDLFGNVREWVTGLDDKPITKGGSWADDLDQLTPFARIAFDPSWQATDPQHPKSNWWLSDGPWVGFRVVRVP